MQKVLAQFSGVVVAAGILPAVEPWLPARRNGAVKTQPRFSTPPRPAQSGFFPGGKMPALYGRQDACRYGSRTQAAVTAGLAVIFICLLALIGSAATFTATLDRDTVAIGESATLTLKFEGGKPKTEPTLPNIPNLQITGQGSAQSYSFVNGAASSSLTHTYAVTPTQPGDYAIPTLGAIVDGKVLTSPPLKLKAVKPTAAASQTGDQLAFLKLFVPKREVFLGEVFGAQLQLCIREGVANGDGILDSFENLAKSGSPLKVEGCNILKTSYAQRRPLRIGNGNYTVATLVTALAPLRTGTITIDSINATLSLQLPAGIEESVFGRYQRFTEQRVPIVAESETLTALAVPRENAPVNFNGAVGNYTLAVTAGPTNVAAGDPITVRIQLTGSGALDALALPDQPAWREFKTYPPTAKVESTDPLGIQGNKTFEQVVVPQSTDIRELPPISFSYFDSDKKLYRTLTQPAIGLIVRPGGASVVPTIAASSRPSQENAPPAQDIVSIKQHAGKLAPISRPLLEQPWFITLQSVPALAFLGTVIWRKRSDSLANNPRRRRQRKVAQLIRDGLNELRKFAAGKNSDEFFATLFRLLQEQLGERLDLPAAAITEAVIEDYLRPRGVSATTLTGLHELFQTCNLARYAPIQSSQELAAMIPKLEAVLDELQKMKA